MSQYTDKHPECSGRSVVPSGLLHFDRSLAKQGLLVACGWHQEPRWQLGDRLHHLFERRCDQLVASGQADHLAVDSEAERLSYPQLDERANRLANWMMAQGYGSGSVVALLLDKSAYSYVCMLAVQKIHAAYVPLDPAFPADRIAYICEDADAQLLLTLSAYEGITAASSACVVILDSIEDKLRNQSSERPDLRQSSADDAQLSYIIYTSGSTGRPKGVPISQANIVNFVAVAAEVYGYQASDRVYQGLTIAFDFAVEEIWVPLAVGATLLPNQTGSSLLGEDLHEFLSRHHATAMCCVPTLLQTIEDELPELRLLIVSGEACPRDLIERWWSPKRSILNAYGPTETTVTATLAFSQPGEAVTIGQPLPTYTVLILDPEGQRVLPFGEEGEICVAGIGVAEGYLNRPDQTEKAFINDFLGLENNPSGLIYRTGDLGSINDLGLVEYRGRIDLQVKIRGYRIELTEIESAILQLPGVTQAVVDTFEPMPGAKELVAYYTVSHEDLDPGQDGVVSHLRELMPAYMVPAYYEKLDVMPMMASDKADRKALPQPKSQRLKTGQREYLAPRTETERVVAEAIGSLLRVEKVSAHDHFFDDLGASSLLMARLGAVLRKKMPDSQIAMRDFYSHPTVSGFAAHLDSGCSDPVASVDVDPWYIPSTMSYYLCGGLQLLTYLMLMLTAVWVGVNAVPWVLDSESLMGVFLRTAAAGSAFMLGSLVLSVSAKWLLIGRWKATRIPLWSLAYFRFWLVRLLVRSNPLAFYRGSPLYSVYLRLLGAKIGRNVILEPKDFPLCTDLLQIGDNTVVRQDAKLTTFKARSNYMYLGGITLGEQVVVGEGSVIDLNTQMEDGAQLGHASCLLEGQVVPAGDSYHGHPAEPTETNFRFSGEAKLTRLRSFIYATLQLVVPLLLLSPMLAVGLFFFAGQLELPHHEVMSVGWFVLLFDEVLLSFLALMVSGLVLSRVAVRLANRFLQPGKVYVVYGFHYALFRLIKSLSNIKLFVVLFGDSSYITSYLKWLGYELSNLVQTGSNFGIQHRQDNPLLCRIGSGTMISDGLNMMNAQESSTAFCLQPVSIGDNNFFGNQVFYPADSKTGHNCLIATKAMIPIDGKVRENTGLLGSPSFEIPRAVELAPGLEPALVSPLREARLGHKNRHNLLTMALFLGGSWVSVYMMVLIVSIASVLNAVYGPVIWLCALLANALLSTLWFIFIERASLGFRSLQPITVSIYDPVYWRVERYWKLSETPLTHLFKGTPMRNVLNRVLGVRVGKMVFDDGFSASEKTLVKIGDYCNFNTGTVLQSHSLEDGIFKSDYIKIGNRCVLEPLAFVHYGVEAGDGALVVADSFVMKGESLSCRSAWSGNPAQQMAQTEVVDGNVGSLATPNVGESMNALASPEAVNARAL